MENFTGFRHTTFASRAMTLAAADYVIPQPASIGTLGPSIDPVNKLEADQLELRAPAGNAGNIFVDLEGTADTGDLILRPGDAVDISGPMKITLSALASLLPSTLEIIAKWR